MEWRELAELRLRDMSERTSHPYVLLENWVGELPQRERLIFTARLATPEGRPTLQELGGKLGITRERVRQLEKQLYAELRTHLGTRGRPPDTVEDRHHPPIIRHCCSGKSRRAVARCSDGISRLLLPLPNPRRSLCSFRRLADSSVGSRGRPHHGDTRYD